MAEIKGKMITCERCGSEIFLKEIGKKEMDGGFTTVKNYEEAEGWKYHIATGYLCPECEDAYFNLMGDFMDNKHHEITINRTEAKFYNL